MANWGRILSRGNVEDRRSFAPVAAGGMGIAGLAIYLLMTYLSGGQIDVIDVANQLENAQVEQNQTLGANDFAGEDEYETFASKVLGSNNDMWFSLMQQTGKPYTPPKLVLFRTATQSSCGTATSQVGPHYCPLDQTIYLDETFFDEMIARFGAKGGDVAEAYVIAHEVGHHAQNELGLLTRAQDLEQGDADRANEAAIQTELQADCFAGLWANSIKDLGVLDPGEIHEAMDAASAVGDDRIQEKVTGYVNPETWTHGSSQERVAAFNTGFESGNLEACEIN
jgi:predicted metalloprotease